MPQTTFLLPPASVFAGQQLDAATARALGRADSSRSQAPGRRAQLRRHFTLIPDHWPVAALTRQADAGDAAGAGWLRADPAYVRPDINGARLLACGDMLGLTTQDCATLLPALKPLFGDTGFPIDAPTPSRWYLRLPRETKLPAFTEPADALGADLFEHMAEGSEGRRWRALMAEAQVVLHNHPLNVERAARGRPPVNSLWFWGGGALPDTVHARHATVCSGDSTADALAHAAGVARPLPERFVVAGDDSSFDLHTVRDLAQLDLAWLQPACAALARGELQALELDFEDGRGYRSTRGQRWRFWRRPISRLDA